jgi:hypothetical protein
MNNFIAIRAISGKITGYLLDNTVKTSCYYA